MITRFYLLNYFQFTLIE